MPALTLRPAPLDRVAALRALPAVVIAVAGGAWLALAIAVVFGADLGGPEAVWIGLAGACACLSGLMVGAGGNVAGTAMVAGAAIAAALLAGGAARDSNPVRETFPARADRAPARADKARADAAPAQADKARQTRREPRVGAAGRLVRSYYAAIDAGDFAGAWARLSPGVHAALGGFEVWRRGYATTLQQRVEAVEVDGDVIRHVLVARDRTPCGTTVEQRFAVEWTVVQDRATALHAVRLAGQDPAAAC